jgi:hypothetical protein
MLCSYHPVIEMYHTPDARLLQINAVTGRRRTRIPTIYPRLSVFVCVQFRE